MSEIKKIYFEDPDLTMDVIEGMSKEELIDLIKEKSREFENAMNDLFNAEEEIDSLEEEVCILQTELVRNLNS